MTTDTPMVELCALIFAQWADAFSTHYPKPNSEMVWDDYSPTEQLIALSATRAVLECLRTPTPEMVEAMGGLAPLTDEERFTAAIDHALSPSKGEGE